MRPTEWPFWANIADWVASLAGRHDSPAGEGLSTSFEHTWPWPPWATLLVLLAAAVIIVLLYARESRGTKGRLRILLAGSRIALILLVITMLYGWTRQVHRTDLPDLVILLDDSQSMAVVDYVQNEQRRRTRQQFTQSAGWDEPTRFNLARSLLLNESWGWLERLAERYRVKLFVVSSSARALAGTNDELRDKTTAADPAGTSSKLGKGLRAVLESQRGRPTAAVVMLTDGVTTEGATISDAADFARRKSVPLYLLGIGSDRPPRDVRVSDLLVDEVVFVDEVVNFDVALRGNGYPGQEVAVRLLRADRTKPLAERTVLVPQDGETADVRLAYRPDEEGEFLHTVEVATLDGEINTENNQVSQRVVIRDATVRVLMVQAQPSYEFRFLKDLLGRVLRKSAEGTSPAVQLTTVLQEADLEHADQDATAQAVFPVSSEELFDYDVIVFGDVDPSFLSRSAMENIAQFVSSRGGGLIFVAGPRFTPVAFRDSPLEPLMPIDLSSVSLPPPETVLQTPFAVQPTPIPGLSSPMMMLGDSQEETVRIWNRFPQLYWSLATVEARPAARVLAVDPARTGPRGEDLPIVLMQFVGSGKVVFHATDETYRWSRWPGDERSYARYWLQLIRYLSRAKLSRDDRVEMTTDRQEYQQGETVRLRVRFLDERQAPVEDDGVTTIVEHVGGRKYPVTLQRNAMRRGLFEGTISDLPEGHYRAWLATANEQTANRHFRIAAPPGEQARVEMDAGDLKRAAEISQGRFYTLSNFSRLPAELPRGRRVVIESLPPRPIWNSPFVAGLFVLLITTEWILRKRAGMV
jgi:hypothetical protein